MCGLDFMRAWVPVMEAAIVKNQGLGLWPGRTHTCCLRRGARASGPLGFDKTYIIHTERRDCVHPWKRVRGARRVPDMGTTPQEAASDINRLGGWTRGPAGAGRWTKRQASLAVSRMAQKAGRHQMRETRAPSGIAAWAALLQAARVSSRGH